MTQNRSHAVMAQRHEPDDSLDFFPTPPFATRALFEHVIGPKHGYVGLDPCCGDGAMLRPMYEYMLACGGCDVHDYGLKGLVIHDFLQPFDPPGLSAAEWIIMNPPFRLGQQFILRALDMATHGVCALVRTAFVESADRYNNLFFPRPPALVAQFVERVPMVKGRLDRQASTATSYCWLVWGNRAADWERPEWAPEGGTQFLWIPPCRAKLERATDYPVIEETA